MNDLSLRKRIFIPKKQYIILTFLMIILIIGTGIGYAYVQKQLTIIGNVELEKFDPSLYKIIAGQAVMDNIASTYVSSSSGINFSYDLAKDATSSPTVYTNGKGVYTRRGTQNDTYPIHYFRDTIEAKNNVIFANFCWKIIRTTEKGGIKILYNGTPTDGKCSEKITENIGFSYFNNPYDYSTYHWYSSPADAGYMYGDVYESYQYDSGTKYYFGSSATYNSTTGLYTLGSRSSGTVVQYGNTKRYTCLSSSSYTCQNVYYVVDAPTDTSMDFKAIILSDGDLIANAKEKMFSNKNDSDIKKKLDEWYENNLTSYTSYLEDAVWCNDRTTVTGALHSSTATISSRTSYFAGAIYWQSSWADGRNSSNDMTQLASLGKKFLSSNPQPELKDTLTCPRGNIDRFTVNDTTIGNGKLTYPIGLLTAEEVIVTGTASNYQNSKFMGNYASFIYSESGVMFTMTPAHFSPFGDRYVAMVSYRSPGSLSLNGSYGQPAVVLKNGIEISAGTGASDNPYIIK